ncbi:MAG: ABC transporter ATP-binding protein [Deltaproteobacteria bacterium]|nr:ABC transporter ATP-binding protein [Deltaproteobacteria bacterium]
MDIALETKDVTKIYRQGGIEVVAVEGVSLSLEAGMVLLIMGPSGSGKTTLLSMMGCILQPTSGTVRVDKGVVSGLSIDLLPDIRKKYFGFVFQSFNLFPSLTATENIEVILRLKGWKKADMRETAVGLLDAVGLKQRAGFYPRDLSGGEKQRVAFARAMAGDPAIILADEPTANLDSKTGNSVLELLKDMAETFGKAVAIVSHDPRAEALAHRVVFLEDGRLRQ